MRNSGGLFGARRYRVGFSGTRDGLTEYQKQELHRLLTAFRARYQKNVELHHGDCIGGDYEVHQIARALGYTVVAHPPLDEKLRAFCDAGRILEPLPYLKRNQAIVNSCNILVAAPATAHEVLRSGTWSTIRYARSLSYKPIVINPAPNSEPDSNV